VNLLLLGKSAYIVYINLGGLKRFKTIKNALKRFKALKHTLRLPIFKKTLDAKGTYPESFLFMALFIPSTREVVVILKVVCVRVM